MVGAPGVGPGVLVAGCVEETCGKVVSAVAPVVKLHTNGAANVRPVTLLVALLIVAVYFVNGTSAFGASAKLAIVLVGSIVTPVTTGFVQGAAQVTDRLAGVSVTMASLNVARRVAVLIGTAVALLAGKTDSTVGRGGTIGAAPVVNFHTNGLAKGKPVAMLVAAVTVPVYNVSGDSVVPGVSVKLATVLAALKATVPVAFAHGAAHVTVTVALPATGATGSLKVALIPGALIETPVA